MFILFQNIIDFIFPPTNEEIILRSINIEELNKRLNYANKTEFPFIKSIYSYKDKLAREIVWQAKYKRNNEMIKYMANSIYNLLIKENKINIILIPIPISKQRRKDRGYNQCELIIDEIIKINNNLFKKEFGLLIRIRNTNKQTHMNRNERLNNIQNNFEINSEIEKTIDKDRDIILIDDVSTTGSTLREARDTLIKSGFKNIEAITFAH